VDAIARTPVEGDKPTARVEMSKVAVRDVTAAPAP
jgi:hypothetical protein